MSSREESNDAIVAAELSENVETMVAMGYPKDKSENALRRCRNNIQYAVDYIASMEGQGNAAQASRIQGTVLPQQQFVMEDDGDSDDEDTWPAPPEASEQLGSHIQSLIEMGFTKEQAETALERTDGDIDLALTMLLSENNR